MKPRALAIFIAGLVTVAPVAAHHSFALDYFEDQMTSVEGDLEQFDYRSPHVWVHVMARDESGQMRRFSAEWANPSRLSQRGITAQTLRPGDRLIITGSPGRNPAERRIHVKRIYRAADGWQWAGPSGPTLSVQSFGREPIRGLVPTCSYQKPSSGRSSLRM